MDAQNDLQAFLQATQAIAPTGYTLDYFISPEEKNPNNIVPTEAIQNGMVSIQPDAQSATVTVTMKKGLDGLQSKTQHSDAIPIPPEYPTEPNLPDQPTMLAQGGAVRLRKIFEPLAESTYKLTRPWRMFPEHTIFVLKKVRLQEGSNV